MNKESSASRLLPNASRVSSFLIVFFANAISIAIGAGALGGAVASIVVLLLDGPTTIQRRMLDAPFVHPASRVSDDLLRLFQRSAREQGEVSESEVSGLHRSLYERPALRSTFPSRE